MKPIPVVFFGTPDIAANILDALIQDVRFEVVAVVCQPDRVGGRGHQIIKPATKKLAEKHSITCYQPEKLKNNNVFVQQLVDLQATYFVVSAYGRIISKKILSLPSGGCFNVHYSLLPEYRGASPIQWPLLAGKKTTGVTLQKMVYEMDAGDIVATCELVIDPFETTDSLFQKFIDISWEFTTDTLFAYHQGEIDLMHQDEDRATFCHKISKEDGLLDITKSTKETFQMWQGYTSWPGLFMFVGGKRMVIRKCSYVLEKRKEPVGTIVIESRSDYPLPDAQGYPKETVCIVHHDGVLILLSVQLEWKKEMGIDAFLMGNWVLLEGGHVWLNHEGT